MSDVNKFKQFKVWRKSWNNGKGYDKELGKNNVSKSYIAIVVEEKDGFWILEDGKRAKIDERNIVDESKQKNFDNSKNVEKQKLWDEYKTIVNNPSLDADDKEVKRKEVLKKINDLEWGDRKPVNPEIKKLWDEFHKINKDPNLTEDEKKEQTSPIINKINAIKYPKKTQSNQQPAPQTQPDIELEGSEFSISRKPEPEKKKEKPKAKALDI